MAIAVISVVAQSFVSVNYNMVDYLPENAPSTEALEVMEDEFSGSIPNTNVMIYDVSVQEALRYKEELAAIEGISDVMWLDDVIDMKTPIEMADSDTVETYYQNNNALFSFTVADGEEVPVTDAVYEVIGEDNAMAGAALDTATQQKMAFTETMYAAALLVPIIIIILVLSTTSWIEPVFFLTAIGVSVLINLGTNIFIGEISFVTQSVAPILQLAVSLDYAIFLLHSFSDYREKVADPKEAMRLAMKRSFPAIIVSASTTFFGFIALSFMNFEIGSDLGFNLVKGIVLSFISVMVFLPALTLVFYKWMDKTKHRPFIPKFNRIGNSIMKLRIPVTILVLLLIVPAFLAQGQTNFIYGIGEQPESTRAGSDIVKIEDEFGENTQMVLLVPKGDIGKEEQLVHELSANNDVKSIMAYVNTVGAAIPPEYLDESITNQFYSENYSRIILNTTTDVEGEEAFGLIEDVEEAVSSYYADDFYILGEGVTLYDMKNVVQEDNKLVNTITIITIAIALLVSLKSITFPIVLLVTIQASVWINLSIPYFTDSSLVFVGYLIVSTVQLAATIDYGILLTEDYTHNRKKMPALQAIKKSLDDKFFSIVISASILSSVGFILWLTSTNPIVSSIGLLLGRGALLAFILVIVLLPALLVIFDKVLEKTTWKPNYYKEK
ncbi:RND family transporter [Oceanobacillus sp. FSL H7-0719]|uniref:efflux RND transporter permease subunit n=1 Tax=Oceanobacillus sp. FSL H7-0719 TaxID=2954507 RepID=UPI00324DE08A